VGDREAWPDSTKRYDTQRYGIEDIEKIQNSTTTGSVNTGLLRILECPRCRSGLELEADRLFCRLEHSYHNTATILSTAFPYSYFLKKSKQSVLHRLLTMQPQMPKVAHFI
jgi:hypothetical protein